MKISKRIRAIEELIPYGSILADIGCDHAYLDCLAVKNGRCLKCYACDVVQGPLKSAEKTIEEMGCKDSVIPILSDGLENVPSDANVCVISGMGFETIRQILEEKNLSQFHTLILQANCDVDALRRWVISINYKIVHEVMVHEGHYYTILVIEQGIDSYDEDDYLFGKFLNDDVFKEYWQFRKCRMESFLPNLKDNKQIDEISSLIERINRKISTS